MANAFRRQCPLYPPGLADGPADVKLQFFKDAIIEHQLFNESIEQIGDFVKSGLKGTMVVLVGPAGVGKSSLGESACSKMNKAFFEQYPHDMHTIPAAIVEAWGPEFDRFDWYDFYELLLHVLQAPLVEATLPEVKRVIAGRAIEIPLVSSNCAPTIRTLRQRLRRVVVDRNPSMLFVDEASNILVAPRQERVKRQANTLRSIVNKVQTLLVLSGAYDLFDLVLQSGQLARRGQVVHFRAYVRSEVEAFCKALIAMQNCMPMKKQCDLTKYADILAEQSLLTVGHLKYILLRALKDHYKLGRPIDEEILARAFYKPDQLEMMRADMYDGYERIEHHRHPDDHRIKTDGPHESSKRSGEERMRPGQRVGKTKPGRREIG